MAAPVSVAEAIALVAEPAEPAADAGVVVDAVAEMPVEPVAPVLEAAPVTLPVAAPSPAVIESPLDLGGLILVTTQVQDAAPVATEPTLPSRRRRADLQAGAAVHTAAESVLQQVETASLIAPVEVSASLPLPEQARRANRVVHAATEEAAAMVQVETR
jgi:hypothetical protein